MASRALRGASESVQQLQMILLGPILLTCARLLFLSDFHIYTFHPQMLDEMGYTTGNNFLGHVE